MTLALEKRLTQGTHRSCSPEQTLAKVQPYMSAMGITRIANITGLDNIGIPVVTVCRPNAKAISVAQGKGLSLAAAKASGLMEAVETFHGEQIELPLRLASFAELNRKNAVVDVMQLPRYGAQRNGPTFHRDKRILWIEGQDLATEQNYFVPYELVHCDYSVPFPTGSGAFLMSTNGLASGNHLAEAISHGLCELIERDATTLWQLQRKLGSTSTSLCKLDLDTVDDPTVRDLLQLLVDAKVHVSVWHITSDIGIPTFYCTIINKDNNDYDNWRPLYPASGIGTHPSKAVALCRAITEAAQCRLTLISGSRDDAHENYYKQGQNPNVQQQMLQQLKSEVANVDYRQLSSWQNQTFAEDIELLLEQLRAQGMSQVVVVDLSKPEFDIAVVRVVVPGLEGLGDLPGYQMGARAQRLFATKESMV